MGWRTHLLNVVSIGALGAIVFCGSMLHAPLLARLREFLWPLIGLAIALIGSVCFLKSRSEYRYLPWIVLAAIALLVPVFVEFDFQRKRRHVWGSDASRLQLLGRHIVIGYRDEDVVRRLVKRGAIGGIFITSRNVENRSAEHIRAYISELQDMQAANGLPRLVIATDQEGGVVSRLSPPLAQTGSLRDSFIEGGLGGVREMAGLQARGLSDLGVNVNLSPVVDLRSDREPGVLDPFSRIPTRAIDSDPRVVSMVAGEYCTTLHRNRVRCVLKHFPGLGRVEADTHFFSAELETSRATLATTDWVPFRTIALETNALIMLGHVELPELEAGVPASLSSALVQNVIRGDWQSDAVLITDDLNMNPIYYRKGGIEAAGVRALNSGVDLLLVSYDSHPYFPLMHALMIAYADGALDGKRLGESRARLDRMLRF